MNLDLAFEPNMIILDLPFPVSTNVYYRHARGRTYIGAPGRKYRLKVQDYAATHKLKAPAGRLAVSVQLYPPTRAKRDVDNFGGKSLLDALTFSGVIEDDCLVDLLIIERMPVVKGGKVRVFISKHIVRSE